VTFAIGIEEHKPLARGVGIDNDEATHAQVSRAARVAAQRPKPWGWP
jgi:hypothetical protein